MVRFSLFNRRASRALSIFGVIATLSLLAIHSLQLVGLVDAMTWPWWLTALLIVFCGTCLYLGRVEKTSIGIISKLVLGYGIAVVPASIFAIGPYTLETVNFATSAIMFWIGSVYVWSTQNT